MNIGYGINRRVADFAKADIDLDGSGEPRIWIDIDLKARPEMSDMLMCLESGDVVIVIAMSDLGQGGFGQGEAVRKIEAHGAVIELLEDTKPPPEPRKPGPKARWPMIPDDVVKAMAGKWHNPDIYTPHAAIKVAHDAGFKWVTRATMNDNLGPRNAPKSKEPKDG
jgi:hypothetical protein